MLLYNFSEFGLDKTDLCRTIVSRIQLDKLEGKYRGKDIGYRITCTCISN